MRFSVKSVVLFVVPACAAYVTSPAPFSLGTRRHFTGLRMGVELQPEPEGGEELQSIDTMVNTRIKNMGACDDVKSDDGQVYNFWLSTEADGSLVKEIRVQVLKDAAKQANFPGFRKGQIPPYAQPQMTAFAVQEGIIKTCEAAVEAFGIKSIPGTDGEINVNEDVKEMCKGYNVGDTLPFTVNFKAIFDPEKSQRSAEASSESESPVPGDIGSEDEVAATSE